MLFPNLSFLDTFEDIIVGFLAHQVYLAPVLLIIAEEAGLPIPVSDFAIAYTGYQVSLGRISFLSSFFILLVADLLGVSILYFLSSKYGPKIITKFGKYIHLDTDKLAFVEKKFRAYGPLVIIFGRHIPGFREPVTIFSGISRMSYKKFIICTFLSIVWWVPFYLSVGQRLGPKTVQLFHANHWVALLIVLPLILSVAPFFFLRKTAKRNK